MALPIIESPKYSTRLPSTKKLIEYRPFLVKEEKILLMAQESDDDTEMINAMKELVRACTFNKVDPDLITSYDLEYIFLKLRAKAVGETSTINIKCSECNEFTRVDIKLDEVEVAEISDTPVQFMLTDTVGVIMRHIRVKDLSVITDKNSDAGDKIINTIIASIATIFDSNGVYPTDEASREELSTFVNSLSRNQIKEIETFILNTPTLEMNTQFTCSNCGHANEVKLSGLRSFFE